MSRAWIGLAALLGGCALPISLPHNNACVAWGVTYTRTFPHGRTGLGVGCVEERPYPGQRKTPSAETEGVMN